MRVLTFAALLSLAGAAPPPMPDKFAKTYLAGQFEVESNTVTTRTILLWHTDIVEHATVAGWVGGSDAVRCDVKMDKVVNWLVTSLACEILKRRQAESRIGPRWFDFTQ